LALEFVLAFALLGMAVTPAYAQVSKGSISGSVTDPQGALVTGASVTAVSKDTNQSTTAESDSSGLFRIGLLPPGTYRVEVTKQGFRKIVFDNVDVSVGADRGLGAIKLEVGEVSATVEVSSAAPLIQSTEAQVTNSFTAATLQTFAGVLENQGLDNLALTVPGVVNNRDLGFSNTNGTGFAVNGLRGRNNDQQIDGQNNNDNSVAGPGLFVSDVEFVGEYQITTNNFGPEYGRNSGSVVNIIIKSGTNNVHGAVYGTESNSVLNALSSSQKAFQGLTKPARFNDEFTGGTVGGPLWKDHVFFFGGFDNEIVSQQQVYNTGLISPTPAGIASLVGCYGNTTSLQIVSKYGPFGVGGGNPTPTNPSLRNLTHVDPTTGATVVDCGGVEFAGVQRTLPTGSKSYNFPIKLDIQTAKNHFYGRYIYNRSTFYNTDAFGTAAAGYPANVPALSQAYGFSWARTLSSRMSNEFRASYGRLNVEFGGNSIGNTVPGQSDISGALTRITFNNSASLLGFGPATNSPQGRIVNTYQLQDNWSYFRGRHSWKAGVNFTYQRSPNAFLPVVNGSYRFGDASLSTPSVFDYQFLAQNVPNRIQIASGNPSLDFREKDTFVYFGDDFKIKNNLTLNLGITWSYYGQPANLFHDRSVERANGSTPLWNPALPLSVTTFPLITAPKNSWGPSVGFAWTPGGFGRLTGNGKTVVRGGYRLSYDPPFYNIYLNISSAAPNVLLNTLNSATSAGHPLPATPTGPFVRSDLAGSLLTGVFDPRTFNETSIAPDFGPQRTHEWRLSVQRELGASAVFEAGYVGNRGLRLFQSINGNPKIDGLLAAYPSFVPSGLTPCTTPTTVLGPGQKASSHLELGRVSCDLGIVRRRTNTGYSDYHGLQMELRSTRLWNQLALKTSYTFSKTTDNASEIFSSFAGGGSQAFSQSQVNYTGEEHGISGLDFRHNWTLSFYEDIPAFRAQHGVIGHILGGWAISGTYFMASGQPYTPIQFALNGASYYDNPFVGAFYGTVDQALRPFAGGLSAPVNSVGVFTGDWFGCDGSASAPCPAGTTPTTLLSMNSLNTTGDIVVVTNNDVRFIANTPTANAQFGTPFGNVARNSLRDARTNIGSFGVFKTVNVKENFKVVWHMSMQNVFNHPNFFSIDPFVDDAGLSSEGTGFADPRVFSGGLQSGGAVGNPGRKIAFGITLRW